MPPVTAAGGRLDLPDTAPLGNQVEAGAAICALMSTRRPKHATSHVRISRWEERDPVSDSDPILRHTSGPSSQLSGPIAGFHACVENGQRLRLPSAPFHRRGPTGLNRTQIAKMKKPKQKKCER